MKKLAIVGLGTEWKYAPFYDNSFEIWGMGSLWQLFGREGIGRADMWWDIHTLETRTPRQIEWLKNAEMPVMMQDKFEEIPYSTKYPLDEIVKKYKRRYFLCTFNYQIAYAMYEGYKEIHFYGVNMMLDDDLIQRWSVEYWLGRAEQSGIKIVLPGNCDLLNSPSIYGYEADNTLAVYIQKYMNELQISARLKLRDAIFDLEYARGQFEELFANREAFMREVIKRHGLKGEQIKEDEECSY